jgi:hypothetical protein
MLAALTALLLSGAAGDAGYYRAEPATPPAQVRVLAGETVWRCGADGCVAGRTGARPIVDCQGLVRAVGRVKSFAAAGAPLEPEQLEKCNAKAR